MLKFQFDQSLPYQLEAIRSITDIFQGQGGRSSPFTVLTDPTLENRGAITELGYANKLDLQDDKLLANVHQIQERNALPLSPSLLGRNFTVEMETGTGKTYVYTRTIFELNKLYGLTKFIIVVPSVAIREGVMKSLQMTEDHFRLLYPGQPFRYFLYDSDKLGTVRGFATSNNIEIMVINIDAFRRSFTNPEKETKANLIHRASDRLSGQKPIELIQATQPVVIIDEPQSVDNTPKSKKAIASLNPLFILRYSATHREPYNLMYRLTPVDAYNQGLVKQVKVISLTSDGDHNQPYLHLVKAERRGRRFVAEMEFDMQGTKGVRRSRRTLKTGDDLFALSNERAQYKGYVVDNIDCTPGMESVTFQNGVHVLQGQVIGQISAQDYRRVQIRKTIEEHLLKERVLLPKGIKVISLFFIDKVANYRSYDADGNDIGGLLKTMFEEEYLSLIKDPRFRVLTTPSDLQNYMLNPNVDEVHDGYFSIDNKGRAKDTSGATKADGSTYDLIMRDKERLLSLNTPLRFIFSHSALKEGWDNPNVFQICTLIETQSDLTRRQKIGRGLRLCVNQKGERIWERRHNLLTVVANESFDEFARRLQTEIEDVTGTQFNVILPDTFAKISYRDEEGNVALLGETASRQLYRYFRQQELVNADNQVTPELKTAAFNRALVLPHEFAHLAEKVRNVILQVSQRIELLNDENEVMVIKRKDVEHNPEFMALWEQIKYRTTYAIEIDVNKLVASCIESIKKMPIIRPPSIVAREDMIHMTEGGVGGETVTLAKETSIHARMPLPDILRYLQDETNLKRTTLVKILLECGRLDDFRCNPQAFMEAVATIIKEKLRAMALDGIKYRKLDEDDCYEMSIFDIQDFTAFLGQNAQHSQKSIYNYLVYDSDVEKTFGSMLEIDDDVKLYVKLPAKFKIDTPLGSYNPDWAVLVEKHGEQRLYFVIETKGSTDQLMLRGMEQAKIECGMKHFEAIDTEVEFKLASDYEEFKRRI